MLGRAQDYLLYPTEVNYLTHQIARKYHAEIPCENLKTFHIVRRENKRYVITPVCKDAQTESNESDLKSIDQMIMEFISVYKDDRDYHLLMPMRMCRGRFKLPTSLPYTKREHLVLVEVDLKNMAIQVHDSQLKSWNYPDKFTELKEIAGMPVAYDQDLDYHGYGVQDDHFSCGYYVLAYLDTILETGNSSQCCLVKLNVGRDYLNKKDYFTRHDLPEYLAFINGVEVRDDAADSLVQAIDENDEIISVAGQRKTNVNPKAGGKASLLASSGLFKEPDYRVELDPPSAPAPAILKASASSSQSQ